MKQAFVTSVCLAFAFVLFGCGGESGGDESQSNVLEIPPSDGAQTEPDETDASSTADVDDAGTATDDAVADVEAATDSDDPSDSGPEDTLAEVIEEEDVPDEQTEEVVDDEPEVIEDPGCEEDVDCEDMELPEDGCWNPACVEGICDAVFATDCCETAEDCVTFELTETCTEAVCIEGRCAEAEIDNCCVNDADCVSQGDGCCLVATCSVESTCEVNELESCCNVSADCNDDNIETQDLCMSTCVADGCANIAPPCAINETYTAKNFDDGTLQSLSVNDYDGTDNVGISTSKGIAVSQEYSVYFGDPACETYYDGPMTECVPDDPLKNDSSNVILSLSLNNVALGESAGAYLSFWVKMAAEPPIEVELEDGPKLFDVDYLQVTVEAEGVTTSVWRSTDPDAVGSENTTHGNFAHQAANLSEWAGKAVTITFSFITDAAGNYNKYYCPSDCEGAEISTEGADDLPICGDGICDAREWERWYGVYIDDINVVATCAAEECDGAGSECPDDGNGCTVDTCTAYSVGAGGICAYETATPGQECESCAQPADCGTDACFNYTCAEGFCGVELKGECCSPSSSFPESDEVSAEGFENADLSEWTIEDPYPDDSVTWQISGGLPYEGTSSLYFGDPLTQSYDAGDNPAHATIWSPYFTVDTDQYRTPVANFWLWLSTEYDGALVPPDLGGVAYDTFTIHLDVFGPKLSKEVWNSLETISNSTGGDWTQIGLDLSAYRGDTIRLGFEFDSADNQTNGPASQCVVGCGGVRIDEFSVTSFCGTETCFGSLDCSDDDPCTTDWCELGVCMTHMENPACCFEDDDCDDDNQCTLDTCTDGNCGYAYDETKLTNCCSEGPWLNHYSAGFESGDDGFTTVDDTPPSVWHLVSGFGATGDYSFGFSDPATGMVGLEPGGACAINADCEGDWQCDAATGQCVTAARGKLVSAPVMVPPFELGTPYAEFMLYLETEWDTNDTQFFDPLFIVDDLYVKVAAEGNVDDAVLQWTSAYLSNTTEGAWVSTRVNLADYRGQEVQLVFEFDTGDHKNNDIAGPFVDDVSFGTTCKTAAAVQCVYGGECTTNDACMSTWCSEEFKCEEVPKQTDVCCAPSVLDEYTMDFEGDDAGWNFETCVPGGGGAVDTFSVWNFSSKAGAADIFPKVGDKVLYFGNGQDYGGDDASAKAACGIACSPPFTLEADVPWTLDLWFYLDVQKSAPGSAAGCNDGGAPWDDAFKIVVNTLDLEFPPEAIFTKDENVQCNEYNKWTKEQDIDLSAWAGKEIEICFEFDTYDGTENAGKGIAIDGLEFTRGCPDAGIF